MIHTVVVTLRLSGVAPGAIAEAFMARDETATVWIEDPPRSSRVVVDLEAAGPDGARSAAIAFVTDVASGVGATAGDATAAIVTREE